MLLDDVICIYCKGELNREDLRFICSNCCAVFDIIDGVPILMQEIHNDHTKADIGAWEDKMSGRLEHELPNWRMLAYWGGLIADFFDHIGNIDFVGRVLELGCGMSYSSLCIKFLSPGSKLICSDVSLSAIKKTKELTETHRVRVDDYAVIDAHSIPFPDNYFDVVYTTAVLHHIPDLSNALREIRRVLKPGKFCVFTDGMCSKLMKTILKLKPPKRINLGAGIEAVKERDKYPTQEALYTYSEWVNIFLRAGFSSNDVEIALCKDPRYKTESKTRLAYYLLLGLIPDVFVRKFLGCRIHIFAKKNSSPL